MYGYCQKFLNLKYKTKYSAQMAQENSKTLRANAKRYTKLTSQLEEQISKDDMIKITLLNRVGVFIISFYK